MSPPPRLIAELVTLTRPLDWTLRDLARELHVSEVTLQQYRSGRRSLSLAALARITERFGTYREIRDLVFAYLRDYHTQDAVDPATPPDLLPPHVARALAAYTEKFAEESVHGGRGLFVVADEAALLSASVSYLRALFAQATISIAVLRADTTPAARDLRDAAAVPLLIVERVDFVSAIVAEIVQRRADVMKPIIATSMAEPSALRDAYLRRIFTSVTRLVDLRTHAHADVTRSMTPSLDAHAA